MKRYNVCQNQSSTTIHSSHSFVMQMCILPVIIICIVQTFPSFQAFFSSVIPGEEMKGFLGKPEFPRWLGQNSKKTKCDKMLQDLSRHTQLMLVHIRAMNFHTCICQSVSIVTYCSLCRTSCTKTEFGLDYLPFLSSKLISPLLDRVSLQFIVQNLN